MKRPSHQLAPHEEAEWLQMEVDAREAEARATRRTTAAIFALLLASAALGARALWLLTNA